ncbi:MAG: glycosyltransferase family 2 protein [Bacteroidota bacterium]|nr:glycosyltransferase family 2 protein [Bacteroidota bacterium]
MSEDLSRIQNLKIDYQFWVFSWRIVIKDIDNGSGLRKSINKRIVQFNNFIRKPENKSVPIVINNFNRLSFLRKQIDYLHKKGFYNLYIIDNNSTYQPLLDYYKKKKVKVFYLKENVGYLAVWKTVLYEYFKDYYYVYTDADILPHDQCPDDFISYFKSLLDKYPHIDKVGFGLKTDDLPDEYILKDKVQEHESQFWNHEVEKDVYEAMIDTTFALYRPRKKGGYWLKALRTGGKYVALHLPWYTSSYTITEEDKFYNDNIKTSTHWTELLKNHSTEGKMKIQNPNE